MSRLLMALAPSLALALVAGCIAPEAFPQEEATTAAAPPADRIAGMTVDAKQEDKIVPCGGNNSTLNLPTGCAERRVEAAGRIGETALPVHLMAMNGPITISASDDDSWSFTALVRVQALTPEDAKKGLDTAWSWSHVEGSEHALRAGPNMSLPLLSATLVMARYEVELPAWIIVSLDAHTSNAPITISGLQTDALTVITSNGPITLDAAVVDVNAKTSNGAITAILVPRESGDISLDSSNGSIRLEVPESAAHGYDAEGATSNGRVTIELEDGTVEGEGDHASFKTRGYDERAIKTTLNANTSNAAIVIG